MFGRISIIVWLALCADLIVGMKLIIFGRPCPDLAMIIR